MGYIEKLHARVVNLQNITDPHERVTAATMTLKACLGTTEEDDAVKAAFEAVARLPESERFAAAKNIVSAVPCSAAIKPEAIFSAYEYIDTIPDIEQRATEAIELYHKIPLQDREDRAEAMEIISTIPASDLLKHRLLYEFDLAEITNAYGLE